MVSQLIPRLRSVAVTPAARHHAAQSSLAFVTWMSVARPRSVVCRRGGSTASAKPGAQTGTSCSVTSFRSEEHTSELQSLMRISYAVFCFKKKKQQHTTQYNHN